MARRPLSSTTPSRQHRTQPRTTKSKVGQWYRVSGTRSPSANDQRLSRLTALSLLVVLARARAWHLTSDPTGQRKFRLFSASYHTSLQLHTLTWLHTPTPTPTTTTPPKVATTGRLFGSIWRAEVPVAMVLVLVRALPMMLALAKMQAMGKIAVKPAR